MTTIYVIRHAEADGNVYRRIHGQYDGFVTPRGYRQIVKLAKRFKDVCFDAVYASDLFRTCETARAISETHSLPLNRLPSLREISLGVWEDITWAEAMTNDAENYEIWSKTPHKYHIKGSETYLQIYTRARAELDRIALRHVGGTVAVVTHGTVIRALMSVLGMGGIERAADVPWCDNTAVLKLSIDGDLSYTVDYYNDNSHLEELSTLGRQRWWKDDTDPRECNLMFIPAELPRDMAKADDYYRDAWRTVFGSQAYDSRYTCSRLKKLHAAHPQALTFACDATGQEVGMIALDTRAQLLPNSGHIALIYLSEAYRGREFGAQLLGHAVSVYRAMGRRWITVRVADSNQRARKFYEKYAFEQFGAEQSDNALQLLLRKSIDATPAIINWK